MQQDLVAATCDRLTPPHDLLLLSLRLVITPTTHGTHTHRRFFFFFFFFPPPTENLLTCVCGREVCNLIWDSPNKLLHRPPSLFTRYRRPPPPISVNFIFGGARVTSLFLGSPSRRRRPSSQLNYNPYLFIT